MTTFHLNEITSDFLAQCRTQCDPLADELIERIIASGEKEDVNRVMSKLFLNDGFQEEMFMDLQPSVRELLTEYLRTSGELPQWADLQKIKQGERVFAEHGPLIFMLLNLSSLPLCYSCANGALVLYRTGRLLAHGGNIDPLARRLMETAQMVVNCMTEDGLGPNGRGIVTIQKVRLIHASIRYYLKNGSHGSSWDITTHGEPINQEDLAGTLMSFGPVIVSGLQQLNSGLSPKDIDAYMHCWKVVGHLMGIQEKLLPDSYEDGFALAIKILQHQAKTSTEGQALTDACLKFVRSFLPGHILDETPAFLTHLFLEPFSEASQVDLAGCVGVQINANKRNEWLLSLTRHLSDDVAHLEGHALLNRVIRHINGYILRGVISHFNEGKRVQFYIPPSLRKDWNVSEL